MVPVAAELLEAPLLLKGITILEKTLVTVPEFDELRIVVSKTELLKALAPLAGVTSVEKMLVKVPETEVLKIVLGAAELLETLLLVDGVIILENILVNKPEIDVLRSVLGEMLPLAGPLLNEGLPTELVDELRRFVGVDRLVKIEVKVSKIELLTKLLVVIGLLEETGLF